MTQLNLSALHAAAAQTGIDQSKVSAGADLPAEGPCDLRFVGYIELGKHKKTFKGVEKTVNKAVLVFELCSSRHQREFDGKRVPVLIRQTVNLSQSQRASWPKIFAQLNYDGTATHAVQCLGRAYCGAIHHREYQPAGGGDKRKAADLNAKDMPIILSPPKEFDRKTGQYVPIEVDAAVQPLHALLWDNPSTDQWASIFVDGAYEEEKDATGKVTRPGRTKNLYQEQAKRAINFDGSPLKTLLTQAGADITQQAFEEDHGEGEVSDGAGAPAAPWVAGGPDALSGVALS